jgi:hypothetical protein
MCQNFRARFSYLYDPSSMVGKTPASANSDARHDRDQHFGKRWSGVHGYLLGDRRTEDIAGARLRHLGGDGFHWNIEFSRQSSRFA